MNADHIVAEPATLTGSIGVFAGKFTIGGLMEKLGINWDTLKTSDNAGMWSMIDRISRPSSARASMRFWMRPIALLSKMFPMRARYRWTKCRIRQGPRLDRGTGR